MLDHCAARAQTLQTQDRAAVIHFVSNPLQLRTFTGEGNNAHPNTPISELQKAKRRVKTGK